MGRTHTGRSSSHGFIRVKTLVALVVLGGVIYLATKLGPPYWNYLAMHDPVKEAAMAFSHRRAEAQIRSELIARARATDVTLDEENVEFFQRGNFAVVSVRWGVPVELPLYRRVLHFHIEQAVPAP